MLAENTVDQSNLSILNMCMQVASFMHRTELYANEYQLSGWVIIMAMVDAVS